MRRQQHVGHRTPAVACVEGLALEDIKSCRRSRTGSAQVSRVSLRWGIDSNDHLLTLREELFELIRTLQNSIDHSQWLTNEGIARAGLITSPHEKCPESISHPLD